MASKKSTSSAETRAAHFLAREVPRWFRENQCFSCHNNGDAARALYTARAMGYAIPATALAETSAWLERPANWEENKGDPAISDKVLAQIQFTVALAAGIETAALTNRSALLLAAEKLISHQRADGAWVIEPDNALGGPTTYGTRLATVMTAKALTKIRDAAVQRARERAGAWVMRSTVQTALEAGATLMWIEQRRDMDAVRKRAECLKVIHRTRSREGAWGPYKDTTPEAFDTAVVLLGLAAAGPEPESEALIVAGRSFLLNSQMADGSWPETTRPAGGESYAQRISTTGWAMLALLAAQKF